MRSAKAIERELTAIERSLWANDAGIYEVTYLPDAVLIFPEVGRIGRDAAVAAIREENAANRRWAAVDFASIRTVLLSPDVALLSYEATARWNDQADRRKRSAPPCTSSEPWSGAGRSTSRQRPSNYNAENVLNTRCAPIRYAPHAPRPYQFGG
jgi:hypothetical protein